ncbi:MAG: hypothetical protein OES25_01790 [Acidobacteriota bacterium]|nr:hypothetical protein [Acidobacteriota bacterium]
MKKSAWLLVALLIGATTVVVGQERGRNPRLPENRLEKMETRLTLTAEQMDEVRPIIEKSWNDSTKLRESTRGSGSSPESIKKMRDEMDALQQNTRKQLAEILTGEQLAEYDRMTQEEREEMRQRRRRRMRREES